MPTCPPLRARLLRALVALGLTFGALYAVSALTRTSAPARDAPPGRSAAPPRVEDSRFATLQTAAGPVIVAKTDLARLPRDQLSAAVQRARAAGLQASEAAPWHLQSNTACGWFLRDRADAVRVLPTDLLRRVVAEWRDGREERRALAAAAVRVSAKLSRDLEPGYRVALKDTLRRLSLPDEDPDSTRLNPGYARLILAEGWLARVAPDAHAGARQAVEEALAAAMAMRTKELWIGERHELARVADAWGEGGTVYRALERTVVVVRPPPPMDDSSRHDALASCETVIELSADLDPVADPAVVAEADRVALLHDGIELVSWSRAEGSHVDRRAWRRVFPERGDDWAEDAFPPHVVIGGLDRSVQGLVVTQGVLRPVADGSAAEAERFLVDAARLLPDAAHLDLVQQYLMKWVYDSPDPTQPLAIGCKQANGDIHQTARQVLATTAGGISRGDCDDFAELAWDLARRQGRPAHVLSVPGHLAAVWAEQRKDGWHVFVLQTGPVLQFRNESLARALYETYAYYEDTEPVDPDALSVAVRFDGESTRGKYALSWRIFAEPDYATTLIGVQEDWHNSTLLQGIVKMRAVIEGGDHDPANYAELGALYAGTGQYGEAAAAQMQASRNARGPEGRVHRLLDVFQTLVAGEQIAAAVVLGDKLAETLLPRMVSRWGSRTAQVQIEMASALASRGETAHAARLLAAALRRPLEEDGPALDALVGTTVPSAAWGPPWERRTRQSLLSEGAYAALAILEHLETTTVKTDRHVRAVEGHVATWLANVAFTDLEDREDELYRWALYGRWYALREPEGFLDRLEAAPFPERRRYDAHQALARTPEDPAVLSWIRTSPYICTSRLNQQVEQRTRMPDPALIRRWGELLEESVVAARRLGYDVAQAHSAVHAARLQVALLTNHEADLRRLFRKVKRLGDSRLRGRTVSTLGQVAPHMDLQVWQRVVACWVEEVDYPPNYYDLAWSTALAGAPAHALHVADLAAQRFASDAAFVEEARYMHELLGE